MRIDASNAGTNWRAWDARRCFQPALTFADDKTHQYGMAHVLLGPDGLPFRIVEVVRQAQCVRILRELKLILINPVDDDELDTPSVTVLPTGWGCATAPEPSLPPVAVDQPIHQPWWRKWLGRRK